MLNDSVEVGQSWTQFFRECKHLLMFIILSHFCIPIILNIYFAISPSLLQSSAKHPVFSRREELMRCASAAPV